jgi:hypothetical protein
MPDREQPDEDLGSDQELLTALESTADSSALATVAAHVLRSGDRSCREDRLDHGLLLYRAVIDRFQGTEEFQFQSLSVQALLRSGAVLTRLGRLQEAAEANQAIFKYGEGAVAALDAYADWYEKRGNRERLASALMAKAVAIGALERGDETVAALNDVIARFQGDTSPTIQAIVAKAQEGLKEVGASVGG